MSALDDAERKWCTTLQAKAKAILAEYAERAEMKLENGMQRWAGYGQVGTRRKLVLASGWCYVCAATAFVPRAERNVRAGGREISPGRR